MEASVALKHSVGVTYVVFYMRLIQYFTSALACGGESRDLGPLYMNLGTVKWHYGMEWGWLARVDGCMHTWTAESSALS